MRLWVSVFGLIIFLFFFASFELCNTHTHTILNITVFLHPSTYFTKSSGLEARKTGCNVFLALTPALITNGINFC